MVISSEFHMRVYKDDDQDDVPLFIKIMFSDSEHLLVELYTGYSRI